MIPPKRLAEAGGISGPRASVPSVSEELSVIRSNTSDVSESANSPSLRSSTSEWQPARKRGRNDASGNDGEASQGETDFPQPKRARVRGRIEGNQGDRSLLQRVSQFMSSPTASSHPFQERRISEVPLTAKPPPIARKEERQPKQRRINQILSSSPGPEGDEVRHCLLLELSTHKEGLAHPLSWKSAEVVRP